MLRKLLKLKKLRRDSPRHPASYAVSQIFERSHIKHLFGAQLVAAVVFTGILSPETGQLFDRLHVFDTTARTPVLAQPITLTTFEMPLVQYKISQGFSFFHPGIDMTAPINSPIYALESGSVTFSGESLFGYGKHVILSHNYNMESLYGHMSEIAVHAGEKVERGQFIGRVGSTGHSTGPHLHLEIHQNGILLNPLEILHIDTKDIFAGNIQPESAPIASPLAETSPQPK